MLRQLIFPYCIYIVYPRFCFLVAIQPGLAAKRDKHWVCIPPFRPAATFPGTHEKNASIFFMGAPSPPSGGRGAFRTKVGE